MTDDIRYELDNEGILTLTLDIQGQPHNTMCEAYKVAMLQAVEQIVQDRDAIKGIIIASAKESFFAGAELKDFVDLDEEGCNQAYGFVEALKANLRLIETLGVPVVAAVNGTALGGGLEVALACHHRIALKNPKSLIGLPEVSLGLLPGGGGISRTVRMLGLQPALDLMLEGKRLNPEKALQAGLVDQLVDDKESLLSEARAWCLANPSVKPAWDQKGFKIPGGGPSHPKVAQMLSIAPSVLRSKTQGNSPAAEKILEVAVEGAQVDFETACRLESRGFIELLKSAHAQNLIKTFFFQMNELKKGRSRPSLPKSAPITKVGIIGAGMMGAGIAYACAKSGVTAILVDQTLEGANKGKAYSEALVEKQIKRKRLTAEKAEALLLNIIPSDSIDDFANCELVIEAVFEDRALKASVTAHAEKVVNEGGAGAIVASNTSTLPITGLASACEYPDKFIGLHFFSPVDKMPLVEIIRGEQTSDETLAKAFDFVVQIRKTPIVVNDSRGFFTSRVFSTFTHEGMALLSEGVNPQRIENLAKQAGMAVGPLAVSDEVSLSLMDKIQTQTRKDLEEEGKEVPCHPADSVIAKMLEADRAGKASGAGFYSYSDSGKSIWDKLQTLFPAPGENSLTRVPDNPDISDRDVMDRLLYVQAVESYRCFDEGVLTSVADANIGSVMGIGYAPWTGGVLQFINSEGLERFVERAHELATRFGERFSPPENLELRAKNQEALA